MPRCVSCNQEEAILQKLCSKCLAEFSLHVARPDELILTHVLLHQACEHARKGEINLGPTDYNRLVASLNTVCWVMGCPGGAAMKRNIIKVAKVMQLLKAEKNIITEVIQ